ncbi:hypothetical protein HUJ04_001338 [Dendroctonus ponderosae]|nr:hypothetical protein HUJ04_001338 [Dendroctonus ponderosae]
MCCPVIIPCWTHVVKACIEISYFPASWKIANVAPIPKKANPIECGQLRKGYVCAAALCDLNDDITAALDRNEPTALILLDYSKAFNMLHHVVVKQRVVVDCVWGTAGEHSWPSSVQIFTSS